MIGQANRPLLRENRAVSMAPPLLSGAGNCEVEESTDVVVTADRKRRGSVALVSRASAVMRSVRSADFMAMKLHFSRLKCKLRCSIDKG